MKIRPSLFPVLLAAGALALSALPRIALADDGGMEPGFEDADHDRARDLVEHGDIKPLAEILTAVGKAYPGEVVGVQLRGDGHQWRYRIAVLQSDGLRVVLDVDAATMAMVVDEGAP